MLFDLCIQSLSLLPRIPLEMTKRYTYVKKKDLTL